MNLSEIYPKNSKILFVGPLPPPLGGVSVHIKRLARLLNKKGFEVDIFDMSKDVRGKFSTLIRFSNLKRLKSYDIVHFQFYFPKYIILFSILKRFFRFKLYYTDHNSRLFDNQIEITKLFKRKFILSLDCLIMVGEHIREIYLKHQVQLPRNQFVKNAFLPPPSEEENEIWATYSGSTKEFIKLHRPIFLSNASKIAFYEGEDLYGLDMCVELACKLKPKYPNMGFIFALANEKTNMPYYQKIRRKIVEYGLNNDFHFITGQKEIWPLFKAAHVFIRATTTDGDAISIREALHFNCPVIASDVVSRPKGTIIFRSKDVNELYSHISNLLASKD